MIQEEIDILQEQARGPELQKIAKRIANLMSGFVDEGDMRRVARLISSLQSKEEFVAVNNLFKGQYDKSLLDAVGSVEAIIPATRRQQASLKKMIQKIASAPATLAPGMTAQGAAMSASPSKFGTTPVSPRS